MKVTMQRAIKDLKHKFLIHAKKSDSKFFKTDSAFLIHKMEYSREEVIQILHDYFTSHYVVNGCIKIYSVTLLYTKFKLFIKHKPTKKR